MARLYNALSSVNHAIAWTRDRDQLFQAVCSALVDKGGFAMAWIGWHELETRRLVPVARAGVQASYADAIRVYTDDRPEGGGPSGTAFREGRTYVTPDIVSDETAAPWRAQLIERGFHACAAMPIRNQEVVCGTLNVYANEARTFQAKEVALLDEVASALSFALVNLALEADRATAHAAAENERLFSAAMIESMPGIVYFYDQAGRFLRWNRNFEVVSGYSAAEIASMHPLDFFTGLEREQIAARIGDVLTRGESSAEAHFVSKDGTKTPYYFTGRRVSWEGIPCLVGMPHALGGLRKQPRRLVRLRVRHAAEPDVHRCRPALEEGFELVGQRLAITGIEVTDHVCPRPLRRDRRELRLHRENRVRAANVLCSLRA
jgi:PAS domain S-box-containing protein